MRNGIIYLMKTCLAIFYLKLYNTFVAVRVTEPFLIYSILVHNYVHTFGAANSWPALAIETAALTSFACF